MVLPPYGDLEAAIICQGRVQGDCTNIRAEVLAAVRALKMILELRRHLGSHIPIKYMTHSSFVLQILSAAIQPTLYASEINELHYLWTRLCGSVTAVHVKGHKGHAINTLADHAAKQALYFSHFRVVYRNIHAGTTRPGPCILSLVKPQLTSFRFPCPCSPPCLYLEAA